MKENLLIWRKLPPVDIEAIKITIGRNHLPIKGLLSNAEFWQQERALLHYLLA